MSGHIVATGIIDEVRFYDREADSSQVVIAVVYLFCEAASTLRP